ncbi:type IV pilin protein [Halanaerobium polyolivorans]|uniref:type IV pilin protein n=1 Tax=Halanaerobium polyolivorans TaxID=2886943 RepID=UPI00272E6405|nr:type II secretion system protein [Halanaerobium polyolivorans]
MSKIRKVLSGGERGFTLIELLVVIAVLGILAAIAIPRLGGVTDQARLSEATAIIGSLRTAQSLYFTQEGEYTDDTTDLERYIDEGLDPDNWDITLTNDDDDDDEPSYTITVTGNDGAYEGLEAGYTKGGEITTTR